MASRRREDAIAAVERRCPRCAAPRERLQEYCVECGLRLPSLRGAVPALRRRWLRRLGWYPGDWVWGAIPALAVAAGGAAAAIALGGGETPAAGTTLAARAPAVRAGAAPGPPTTRRQTLATWPAGRTGWTIALESYPVADGTAAPSATAARAARAGLPEVGVLDSSEFSSLHPGYYIVFSGVYSTAGEARAALPSVRASGFGGASTRQITR
ncbi:MAG TPA: hypothetical protein VFB42_08350 [Gaiellaceae bacterium]|nr:hypothetical protein [Gaiellaceae bacterium]